MTPTEIKEALDRINASRAAGMGLSAESVDKVLMAVPSLLEIANAAAWAELFVFNPDVRLARRQSDGFSIARPDAATNLHKALKALEQL